MKSKIFLLVIVFVFLMVMGCATFAKPDICVTVKFKNSEEQICKNDAKGLPSDFPDDLFLKWFSKTPTILDPISQDKKGTIKDRAWSWIDNQGNILATIYMAILSDNHIVAWAFVEVNNEFMEIKWVGREATPLQIKFLNEMVENFNQKYRT